VRAGCWKRIGPARFVPDGPFSLGTCCTAQFSRNRKAIIPVAEAKLGGALMTQQDRWWLAISIVWFFLTLGVLLYLGYA
jgi:hypothetical protein